ncbi:MAG: helix-turn-helix transcriptional regulator [Pseudomonadota bacterium]
MPDFARWTREHLNANPQKTQAGLARHLGVNKSAVSRMLSGERGISANELARIVDYLELPNPLGFFEEAEDYSVGSVSGPHAPIYAARGDNEGNWFLDRMSDPVDFRPKGPGFDTATKVFGFYAPTDAMAPRFKTSEIVWVDPGRPPSIGDDVLFLKYLPDGSDKREEPIVVAELLEATETSSVAAIYRLNERRTFNRDEWNNWFVLPRH